MQKSRLKRQKKKKKKTLVRACIAWALQRHEVGNKFDCGLYGLVAIDFGKNSTVIAIISHILANWKFPSTSNMHSFWLLIKCTKHFIPKCAHQPFAICRNAISGRKILQTRSLGSLSKSTIKIAFNKFWHCFGHVLHHSPNLHCPNLLSLQLLQRVFTKENAIVKQ